MAQVKTSLLLDVQVAHMFKAAEQDLHIPPLLLHAYPLPQVVQAGLFEESKLQVLQLDRPPQ